MIKALFFVFLTCLTIPIIMSSAKAADRVALIIGNSDYLHAGRLNNPKNDAVLADTALQSLGFETLLLTDRSVDALKDDLTSFRTLSENAEMALIYFAGHGIQIEQDNYLLAVDTRADDLDAARNSSVAMDSFINAFAPSAKTKLLMLDACRNNPFAEDTRSLSSETTRGLARVNHEVSDLMVVYAAQPNRVALDGNGDNSPFLTAVVNSLTEKNDVKLSDALIEITNRVKTSTNNRQIPYIEGSLSSNVVFNHALVQPIIADQTSAFQCKGQKQEFAMRSFGEDFAEVTDKISQIVISETSPEVDRFF
ncbi:MAG: caspase family protein [Rhizobiaceae bacterium]|nr:caspase family protein [Rhizobiaceae bacterium]